MWGRSLGGGIASKLGSQYPLKGLIIESSYSRLEYLLSDFPMLNIAPKFIYKYFDLNNTENLKSINSPILIIHSKDDDLIPYSHAKEILTAYDGGPPVGIATIVRSSYQQDLGNKVMLRDDGTVVGSLGSQMADKLAIESLKKIMI